MFGDFPLTLEEAKSRRYRQRAGEPQGTRYDPAHCAATVPDGGWSCLFHQCMKKPGKGPSGLYCGIHARQLDRYQKIWDRAYFWNHAYDKTPKDADETDAK